MCSGMHSLKETGGPLSPAGGQQRETLTQASPGAEPPVLLGPEEKKTKQPVRLNTVQPERPDWASNAGSWVARHGVTRGWVGEPWGTRAGPLFLGGAAGRVTLPLGGPGLCLPRLLALPSHSLFM